MKRILVLSDTHRKVSSAVQITALMHPDAIIHLGDLVEDAHELQACFPDIPVYMVRGNNDFIPMDCEHIFTLFGVRLFCAHGHTIHPDRGLQRAKEENCQAFLWGHTHRGQCTLKDGILLLNPGSLTLPRDGIFSFGIIEIDDNGVHGCVCPAEGYLNR